MTSGYLVLVLPLSGNDTGLVPPWKAVFIEWLQKGRTVEIAAHLAGVSRGHVYYCKRQDEVFREAWNLVRKT